MSESVENGEGVDRARRGRLIFLVGLSVAVIAAVAFGVMQLAAPADAPGGAPTSTAGSSAPPVEPSAQPSATSSVDADEPTKVPQLNGILSEPMGGQEAIDALGDDIDDVAERNGMTVKELKGLLLSDPHVLLSEDGFVINFDAPR